MPQKFKRTVSLLILRLTPGAFPRPPQEKPSFDTYFLSFVKYKLYQIKCDYPAASELSVVLDFEVPAEEIKPICRCCYFGLFFTDVHSSLSKKFAYFTPCATFYEEIRVSGYFP